MLMKALNDFVGQRVPEILLIAQKSNQNYHEMSEKSHIILAEIMQLAGTVQNTQIIELIEEFEVTMHILLAAASEIAYRAGLRDAQNIQHELFFSTEKDH